MLTKLTILSALFSLTMSPNILLEVNEENILGEWQLVKLEVYNNYDLESSENEQAKLKLNATYSFLEDNTGKVKTNNLEKQCYNWSLDKSKEGLVMHCKNLKEKEKFYLKSVSENIMILEKHRENQVVVSMLMEKL